MSFIVRHAAASDSTALAALVTDWGYPSDAASVARRLGRLGESRTDVIRVAQAGDGSVAGWIHAAEHQTLASPAVCEILGLVVGAAYRKQGIGRGLVDAVREWAAGRGLDALVVRSNVLRAESHAFYTSLGFTRTKTQHVYTAPARP